MTQVISPNGFVPDSFAQARPVPLAEYAGQGALMMAPTDDPGAVSLHFDTLSFIVIPFASSADGRGFSLAGSLRALGYMGHLRAQGHVLVDQFRAALRCGFDDVEISADQAQRNPEAQWTAVPFVPGYQTHLFAQEGPR
jgi:Uncharacterized protein conserved in bacteria